MDNQKSDHDIRVRNVSFHRRGKPEYGTLYLTKHHLIFRYQPGTSGNRSVSSTVPSNTSSSSNLAKLVNETLPHGHATKLAEPGQTPPKTNGKTQTKEVYVPCPVIHHCILRPSITSSNTYVVAKPQQNLDDEELFPPTLGTSSYDRPSTDSTRTTQSRQTDGSTAQSARPPAIRIRCKDFASFALHFHGPTSDKTADEAARQVFFALRSRCCVSSMEDMYAFEFKPPVEEEATGGQPYDARKEFARMGIRSKAPDGPGSAWRITDINNDYQYSPTYPSVLSTPRQISDNVLKYSASFRSKSRIPALSYLHSNGGSITRASQPLVGMKGSRNPQDEKLVMAIFSSHTPKNLSPEDSPRQQGIGPSASSTSLNIPSEILSNDAANEEDATRKIKIYGSTRRNYIIDARPQANMLANRLTGGGIENIANYTNGSEAPIDQVLLGIANIHVMRKSLAKVVDALGNSDYLDLAPNQELLRKSEWLDHLANMLSGAETVARVVGLGGSHALIHCSDGWDRTAQVSALAQVMLDPYYRTITGFITLVQKDFLAFGHKFRHRQGTEGSEQWFEIENERIVPAKAKDANEGNSNLQAFGSKALTGARTWFEKNKSTIFRQPPPGSGNSPSRPTTPPPANPLIHSSPTPAVREKHKMEEGEVSPVFQQFLECVYQLFHQEPTAFEINERFLRRLHYQSYIGQYGEFLFNNEQERAQYQGRTGSVWAYFLARKHEFTNPSFAPRTNDPLLFPRRRGPGQEIEVRWWHTLYGRKDEEMNIPRPTVTENVTTSLSAFSIKDEAAANYSDGETQGGMSENQARSLTTAHNVTVRHDDSNSATVASDDVSNAQVSAASSHGTGAMSTLSPSMTETKKAEPSMTTMDIEDGDVSKPNAKPLESTTLRGGLDFAAFARSNAFSER